MVAVKINVKGVVQGVGFRYSAAKKAKELAIGGTVQNLIDGSVLIYAEANEKALNEFISWCKIEPSASKVDECQIEINLLQGFNEFSIIR